MEEKNISGITMTNIQFQIIDELYFVTSFDDLLREVEIDDIELIGELKTLLQSGWVEQFIFNQEQKNYIKQKHPVFDTISSHAYLATKEGLLKHNGMGAN